MFSNSELFKLVEGNDYIRFEALFEKELQSVDFAYYFNAVKDWSDSKNVKRTKKGWIATVRQFNRSDNDANKLKVKDKTTSVNQNSAIDYLKM